MPDTDHGISKCFCPRITVLASGGLREGKTLGINVDFDLGARILEGCRRSALIAPSFPRVGSRVRPPSSSHPTKGRGTPAAKRAPPDSRVRTSFSFPGPRLLAQCRPAWPRLALPRPAPPRASAEGVEPRPGAQSATVPACPARANESHPSDSPLPR